MQRGIYASVGVCDALYGVLMRCWYNLPCKHKRPVKRVYFRFTGRVLFLHIVADQFFQIREFVRLLIQMRDYVRVGFLVEFQQMRFGVCSVVLCNGAFLCVTCFFHSVIPP